MVAQRGYIMPATVAWLGLVRFVVRSKYPYMKPITFGPTDRSGVPHLGRKMGPIAHLRSLFVGLTEPSTIELGDCLDK